MPHQPRPGSAHVVVLPWRPHPEIGRVAVHGSTVHYRAAPQHRGDWLRPIDHWIACANSVVEE